MFPKTLKKNSKNYNYSLFLSRKKSPKPKSENLHKIAKG